MASTKQREIVVVEMERQPGAYGLYCTEAIIEHPRHGRLYISQGFGGMNSICGGAHRWRHGYIAKIKPGDTLASLRADAGFMLNEYNRERPLLAWPGHMIAKVAEAAGL